MMGQQWFLQPGGMQGECVGVEYEAAMCRGVAFEGEDQHNTTKGVIVLHHGQQGQDSRIE